MASPRKTALILGASRGLGLALAGEYLKRGWSVIGTVRGTRRTGLHDLAERAAGRLEIERLDITDAGEVVALRRRLAGCTLDLLFANAGINTGVADAADDTVANATPELFTRVLLTNAFAPMRAIEALADLVSADGTIAAMSSGLGSVANNTTGCWEVYRASKAALNTLMRSYAARSAPSKRTLLLVAPGWVRTDMGGPNATFGIDDNIPKVVDVIEAHAGRPGLAYVDYKGDTVTW